MRLKNKPRISIITPAYKCELTLARTLDSLMTQTETSWESIIVDDGSPDGSLKVAEGFAHFDPRFRVFRQPNRGAGAARNNGIAQAGGKYVMFLDADDWLEPGALSALADHCDRHRCSAAHGCFRYSTNDGQPTDWVGSYHGSRPLFDALASSNVLSMPAAVIVLRSVLVGIGGFDATLKNCGDWDLWARVARQRGTFGRVDCCVAGYRMRPASLSHNPHTLLHDAVRTMRRIHDTDHRVSDPDPQFARGADPSDFPARRANFTLYAAGLSIAACDLHSARSLLDTVGPWPALSVTEVAGFLLSALSFARCQGPGMVGSFWLEVQSNLREILHGLEQRTHAAKLCDRVIDAMDRLSGGEIALVDHACTGSRHRRAISA